MEENSSETKAFKKANPGPFYAWPMGLWFTIFFIAPIVIIVCYSFMKRDVYGGVSARERDCAAQQA